MQPLQPAAAPPLQHGPDHDPGFRAIGTPYPSTINVSGLSSAGGLCSVELNGITHTFPDDIDILLVGPGTSQNAIIMSDVGGGTAVDRRQPHADRLGGAPDPDAARRSGTFKPTNVGAGDAFAGAARLRPAARRSPCSTGPTRTATGISTSSTTRAAILGPSPAAGASTSWSRGCTSNAAVQRQQRLQRRRDLRRRQLHARDSGELRRRPVLHGRHVRSGDRHLQPRRRSPAATTTPARPIRATRTPTRA